MSKINKIRAEIERRFHEYNHDSNHHIQAAECASILDFIDSLQQEIPDKDTIIRICKLHKAWSIMAPWENIEDFVTTNWNSENIV